MVHFDGNSWDWVPYPAPTPDFNGVDVMFSSMYTFNYLSVTQNQDIYMLGDYSPGGSTNDGVGVLMQYSNGNWRKIEMPIGLGFSSVHAVDDIELWGISGTQYYRYDGAYWQAIPNCIY